MTGWNNNQGISSFFFFLLDQMSLVDVRAGFAKHFLSEEITFIFLYFFLSCETQQMLPKQAVKSKYKHEIPSMFLYK